MKRTFVQCAQVVLEAGADAAAPGGAVTMALCGSWDHAGACRWPHQTSADWEEDGRRGRVRVVFVADAEEEELVRGMIERALAGGECMGPDGKLSRWEVTEHEKAVLTEGEEKWGAGMVPTPRC